jgi:hypothetical protein
MRLSLIQMLRQLQTSLLSLRRYGRLANFTKRMWSRRFGIWGLLLFCKLAWNVGCVHMECRGGHHLAAFHL